MKPAIKFANENGDPHLQCEDCLRRSVESRRRKVAALETSLQPGQRLCRACKRVYSADELGEYKQCTDCRTRERDRKSRQKQGLPAIGRQYEAANSKTKPVPADMARCAGCHYQAKPIAEFTQDHHVYATCNACRAKSHKCGTKRKRAEPSEPGEAAETAEK